MPWGRLDGRPRPRLRLPRHDGHGARSLPRAPRAGRDRRRRGRRLGSLERVQRLSPAALRRADMRRRRVAATPRPRRGHSMDTSCGDAPGRSAETRRVDDVDDRPRSARLSGTTAPCGSRSPKRASRRIRRDRKATGTAAAPRWRSATRCTTRVASRRPRPSSRRTWPRSGSTGPTPRRRRSRRKRTWRTSTGRSGASPRRSRSTATFLARAVVAGALFRDRGRREFRDRRRATRRRHRDP